MTHLALVQQVFFSEPCSLLVMNLVILQLSYLALQDTVNEWNKVMVKIITVFYLIINVYEH